MRKANWVLFAVAAMVLVGCATSYNAKPLPFKSPAAFANRTQVSGAQIGAKAFVDSVETTEAFGFDILGAGMLPVQIVFDHQGEHPLEINSGQTFLEDNKGNLWQLLEREMAYKRATKYAQTKQIFKKGAYTGLLGAAAGTLIGAAVGIVTGEDVAASAGKGAAVGAAAGATLGGAEGYASQDARREITRDLQSKTMQNKAVQPKSLAHGFLFFPGEAEKVTKLRLQLKETDTGKVHNLVMPL